jgi:hypothetical protein
MAEIVYGEHALSEPIQQLAAIFESSDYQGTFYIGYPILSNVEGTVQVDALYTSKSSGVVVFDTHHLTVTKNDKNIEDVSAAQDRYFTL